MPSTVGLGPLLGLVLWPFVGHGEEVLVAVGVETAMGRVGHLATTLILHNGYDREIINLSLDVTPRKHYFRTVGKCSLTHLHLVSTYQTNVSQRSGFLISLMVTLVFQ